MKSLLPFALLAAALVPTALHAAIPDAVPYQGRIAASGTAFTGTGYFKFAVYQQTPSTPSSAALLWTNSAGTTTGAIAEPASAVALSVANGLFAAGLGDTLVANMASLPASLAPTTGQRAFVRVWFSQSGNAGTFQALSPDTELRSVPFAREAGGVAGIAAANLPQLNAANTFTHVNGLTVQGAAPVDNSPAAGVTVPVSGPGSRMEFIPGLAALRAGFVDGTQWDNIGLYSTALGFNTSAIGLRATALGNGAAANGIGSLSIGSGTTANGWNSTAFGFSSVADGYAATALGRGTSALSEAEIALGSYNTSYAPSSWYGWSPTDRLLTVGNGSDSSNRHDALVILKSGDTTLNGNLTINGTITATNINGSGSTANVAKLDAANTFNNVSGITVQGPGPVSDTVPATGTIVPSGAGTRMVFIPGFSAFRVGSVSGDQWDSIKIGLWSTAMGNNTTASGGSSTAFGWSTTASGASSTAMGGRSTASGHYSTAIGSHNTASDYGSTAMGTDTIASGHSSTALGYATEASGNFSTAMGFSSTASGVSTTAMGDNTSAPSYAETALGCFNTTYTPRASSNWEAGDRLLVVGNGTSDTARSDAFIIYKNGNATLKGTLTQLSDRNAKTDIVAVDTASILAGVAALPISTWKYKTDNATHLGPMAQDFAAAFHLGDTDTGIASVDADGVALASIQELKKQLDAVKADNANKDARLAALEARLAALEAKLAK
jgi:hypothetical protein